MGHKKEKKDKKDKKRKASDSDESDEPASKHKHKEKKHKKDKDKKKDAAAIAEEKRLVKEAKKFLKQRLKDDGAQPSAGPPPDNSLPPPDLEIMPIGEDEYFAKNPEFSAWLRDLKGISFNDLEADDARARFKEFVELWNGRKLPARLYSGVDGGALRRTQHSWGMRGVGGGAASGGVVRGMAAALEEEREAAAAAAVGRNVERRKWKAEQKDLLDEMLPKAAPGREARIDASKARREDAKARDASPDVVNLPGGGDPMGAGGDDSFAAARARQAAQAQRRGRFGAAKAADAQQRVAEFTQKEDATMAQFKALLDRGPIQIPKR